MSVKYEIINANKHKNLVGEVLTMKKVKQVRPGDEKPPKWFEDGNKDFQKNLNARFDKIEIRLDKIETRLDKHDVMLDKINSRLDKHDAMFKAHGGIK